MASSATRRISALGRHLVQPAGRPVHTPSAGKPKFKAVIFDLGGVVLGSPLPAIRSFEKDAGVPSGSIFAASAKSGDTGAFQCLERGELLLEDFYPIFTEELHKHGVRPSMHVEEMFRRMEECLQPNPEMIMAIRSIRAEGLKTAALTNNWKRRSGESLLPFGNSEMHNLFDIVHESCRTGVRKPDPKAYTSILSALKLDKTPECAVFLDDIGSNLKAAKGVGMLTVKVDEATKAIKELETLLGFPLQEFVPGTKSVREALKLDHAALQQYLSGVSGGNLKGSITRVRQFGHGQSNPTYHVTLDGAREFVLRKKPPGKILRGAHAVEREFQVVQALGRVGYPVPKAHVLCVDDAVLGTPFYLMDYVKGAIYTNPQMPGCSPETRRAAYDSMNTVLARMHTYKPSDIGLEEFGKSAGYYGRQVATWTKQYEAAKTGDIPEMDQLIGWLNSNLPADAQPAIVHGDFRIDNLIFDEATMTVRAVLDWELSTVGDPIADLAYNCLPYYLPPQFQIPGFRGIDLPPGIPSEAAYVALYCQRVGRQDGIKNWNFYTAFAFFRIAAILQGVYKRSLQGNASSSYAEQIGGQAAAMAKTGWKLAQTQRHMAAQ